MKHRCPGCGLFMAKVLELDRMQVFECGPCNITRSYRTESFTDHPTRNRF